jgi:hypothetical protein
MEMRSATKWLHRMDRPLPYVAVREGVAVLGSGSPLWQARKNILVSAVFVATAAVVAWYFVSGGSEAGVPHHQRRAAAEEACDASGLEISRLRLQSHVTFVDDCLQPKVTPVFNKAGHVIVTRVVEIQTNRGTARKTYSALMDGRHTDAWRMVQVESAPNELSVILWPPSLAHSDEPREHRSSPSPHSH